jgi:hypothetical protein
MMSVAPAGIVADSPICTIIIATLARHERAASLDQAITSIRLGNAASIKILVIVNGNQFDPDLVSSLTTRTDISVQQISAQSLTEAILAGRQTVKTPYFGFLDDDDEYLPGAVDVRIAALSADPSASVVVSNGYRNLEGNDHLAMGNLMNAGVDPLWALFKENWLASCGGLFRTDHLPVKMFIDIARYLEWTWLAYRIASSGLKLITLDLPGFRIHDTADSESKSQAYLLAHTRIYASMLETTVRPDIARVLKRRVSQSWHSVSEHYLRQGDTRRAWSAHVRSLTYVAGWKFLSFTRHLIVPSGAK